MLSIFILARSEEIVEVEHCDHECINDGICNDITGLCDCSFGCYGELCEYCPLCLYTFIKESYGVELFKIKRYMRIGKKADPFLSNLQAVTISASTKNSTVGADNNQEEQELYTITKKWWRPKKSNRTSMITKDSHNELKHILSSSEYIPNEREILLSNISNEESSSLDL
ncbi:hypothetical protein WA158_002880 [Blastocystis sp. Blastoise]